MIGISILEEDVKLIKKERYEHPDISVQKRLQALYFKSLGYKNKEVCILADISYTTLELILKQYNSGGLKEVKNIKYYSPKSELDDHAQSLEEYFKENPPSTVKEACQVIKELTNIERKETQVRKFLLRLGLKRRKAGIVPGKADPEAQEEFKKKS